MYVRKMDFFSDICKNLMNNCFYPIIITMGIIYLSYKNYSEKRDRLTEKRKELKNNISKIMNDFKTMDNAASASVASVTSASMYDSTNYAYKSEYDASRYAVFAVCVSASASASASSASSAYAESTASQSSHHKHYNDVSNELKNYLKQVDNYLKNNKECQEKFNTCLRDNYKQYNDKLWYKEMKNCVHKLVQSEEKYIKSSELAKEAIKEILVNS